MTPSRATCLLGLWSALATLLFSAAYVAAQVLEWTGLLGSAGGPASASTPLGLALLLTPSLLLGPSFVLLAAALHAAAPTGRKAFSLAALAFATIYATLTGMVYFVQLTFVAPRLAAGETEAIALLLFVPYRSFLFAVDLLGYSFMSAAAFCAAFALPPSPRSNGAKVALLATGALLPFLALQMFFPWMIWPAAAWGISFPVSAILLALMFRDLAKAVPAALTGT
ncbi:conserved hypothetical protein [Altererythrobacter sp. B11]|uniref:hypothetical protein n=1 Tax=Altererythrobacter sp. B11 TaxID=2060312 RepID=UPI000DC7217B|nr:hypothetical protein [Altererythrobacter sp. B11]BBC72219.1 conserved hypothetical protein [Altererythrobacter sp. B11]